MSPANRSVMCMFSGSTHLAPPSGARISDSRVRSELTLADAVGGTREQRTLRGRLGEGGHRLLVRSGDGTVRLIKY